MSFSLINLSKVRLFFNSLSMLTATIVCSVHATLYCQQYVSLFLLIILHQPDRHPLRHLLLVFLSLVVLALRKQDKMTFNKSVLGERVYESVLITSEMRQLVLSRVLRDSTSRFVGPSVRQSVRPSIGPSVCPSVRNHRVEKWENAHFRHCPPVRN